MGTGRAGGWEVGTAGIRTINPSHRLGLLRNKTRTYRRLYERTPIDVYTNANPGGRGVSFRMKLQTTRRNA